MTSKNHNHVHFHEQRCVHTLTIHETRHIKLTTNNAGNVVPSSAGTSHATARDTTTVGFQRENLLHGSYFVTSKTTIITIIDRVYKLTIHETRHTQTLPQTMPAAWSPSSAARPTRLHGTILRQRPSLISLSNTYEAGNAWDKVPLSNNLWWEYWVEF